MRAPETGVTVRMYRTGFGDCFLLAFRGDDGKPVYMLIDCGVHSQYKGGGDKIREVVNDLRAATGGHIEIVAITHEHADHISGFYAGQEIFKEMAVSQAWFGWTEDINNPEVNAIKRQRALMLHALQATQQSLAAAGNTEAGGIGGLLGFFEVAGEKDEVFGFKSADAMNIVRNKVSKPQYLKPKCAPLAVPRVQGVRIFVLGPPLDRKHLMQAEPGGNRGEVYGLATAMLSVMGEPSIGGETFQPFPGNYRILADVVREQNERFPFFHQRYGFSDADPDAWRRIDVDWSSEAESLALKLDAATNNTSLVLAIELPKSKRVLLFAGDAQVGNWESWHEGGWSEENGLAKGETITAQDLLARTVLYKVGHHGSHNATLKEKGLEMMTSDELVAMIPVDQSWAEARKPNPWLMPFHPLYEDLERRTKGRILRTDTGITAPPGRTTDWGALHPVEDKNRLYLELTIPDRPAGSRHPARAGSKRPPAKQRAPRTRLKRS